MKVALIVFLSLLQISTAYSASPRVIRTTENTIEGRDADVATVAWNIAAGICREGMNSAEFKIWAQKRGQSEYISSKNGKLNEFNEMCTERLTACLPGLVVSAFRILTPQPWNEKPAWCETAYTKALDTNKGVDCINALALPIMKALKDKSYSRAGNSSIVSSESNCRDNNIVGVSVDRTVDPDLYVTNNTSSETFVKGLYEGRFKIVKSTGNYDPAQDHFKIPLYDDVNLEY